MANAGTAIVIIKILFMIQPFKQLEGKPLSRPAEWKHHSSSCRRSYACDVPLIGRFCRMSAIGSVNKYEVSNWKFGEERESGKCVVKCTARVFNVMSAVEHAEGVVSP